MRSPMNINSGRKAWKCACDFGPKKGNKRGLPLVPGRFLSLDQFKLHLEAFGTEFECPFLEVSGGKVKEEDCCCFPFAEFKVSSSPLNGSSENLKLLKRNTVQRKEAW